MQVIFTLPVGVMAKYCNEQSVYVCVSVCECVCLRAYFPNRTRDLSLPRFLCMLLIAVARSVLLQRMTKSQEEGAILRFFSIDNALYNIAFRTHTKNAEPLEIPFGMITLVDHEYHVLDGGHDSPRGMGSFRGENLAAYCNVMGHCSELCKNG